MAWWPDSMRKAMKVRDAHPKNFHDLPFNAFVRDPIAAVQGIYARFGIAMAEASKLALQQHASSNPKDKHGRHRYTPEQFGLSEAELGPVNTIWVDPVASQAVPIKARGVRFGRRQMSDEQRRVARPGTQPEGPGPFFPRTALSPAHVAPATPRPLRLARRKNGSRQGQPR